jgi:hypothetical protein
MKVNGKDDIPCIMEKKCSKPPTNIMIEHHDSSVNQVSLKICRFFPWQTVSLQEGISQISALKYHEIPISFSHPGRVPGRFPLGSGELLGDNMGGDRGEASRSEECPRLRSGAPKKNMGMWVSIVRYLNSWMVYDMETPNKKLGNTQVFQVPNAFLMVETSGKT